MRTIIWIMTLIALGYSFDSKADICVIEQTAYKAELSFNTALGILDADSILFGSNTNEFRCQKLKLVQDGLNILTIATEAGSLYAACSGVGTPVAVYLGIAGITLQTVKLAVSQLPCEETADVALIDQLVKENVCIELEKNGLVCEK